MCTGSKTSADDVQNGVSVALNAFFGPKCPNLQQELNSGAALPPLGDAMGSTATSTSQNADSSTGSSSSSNTSPSAAASAPAPASSGALKVSVALAALTALFPAVFM